MSLFTQMIESLKKHFNLISIVILCSLIIGMMTTCYVKQYTHGYNSNYETILRCHDTPRRCCKVYDNCLRMNNETYEMNYTTYYIEMPQVEREGYNCLTMSDLVHFYNQNKETTSKNTGEGRCKINTRCDVNVRKFFDFYHYEQSEKYHFSEFYLKEYKSGNGCPSLLDIITFYNIYQFEESLMIYKIISGISLVLILIFSCRMISTPKYQNVHSELP